VTPVDPLTVPWRPTVDDVAALIRARTKDASANEIGTFTDATRPTDVEVEQLITNGCAKVAALAGGWTIPADAQEEARHLASLVAACEVELSYFPEQIRTDRSAYNNLWAMFQGDSQAFVDFVSSLSPPGAGGTELGTLDMASGTTYWAYTYGFAGLGPYLGNIVNVGH
jgi:hypothetical protein